jgi:hypothetical protein
MRCATNNVSNGAKGGSLIWCVTKDIQAFSVFFSSLCYENKIMQGSKMKLNRDTSHFALLNHILNAQDNCKHVLEKTWVTTNIQALP